MANAWLPDDAMGFVVNESSNPDGAPTHLANGDFYLMQFVPITITVTDSPTVGQSVTVTAKCSIAQSIQIVITDLHENVIPGGDSVVTSSSSNTMTFTPKVPGSYFAMVKLDNSLVYAQKIDVQGITELSHEAVGKSKVDGFLEVKNISWKYIVRFLENKLQKTKSWFFSSFLLIVS